MYEFRYICRASKSVSVMLTSYQMRICRRMCARVYVMIYVKVLLIHICINVCKAEICTGRLNTYVLTICGMKHSILVQVCNMQIRVSLSEIVCGYGVVKKSFGKNKQNDELMSRYASEESRRSDFSLTARTFAKPMHTLFTQKYEMWQ